MLQLNVLKDYSKKKTEKNSMHTAEITQSPSLIVFRWEINVNVSSLFFPL